MPRTVRDAKLDTRSARFRLAARRDASLPARHCRPPAAGQPGRDRGVAAARPLGGRRAHGRPAAPPSGHPSRARRGVRATASGKGSRHPPGDGGPDRAVRGSGARRRKAGSVARSGCRATED